MGERLWVYHLRLALTGLLRNPVVSVMMLVALALGNGLWSLASSQYVRFEAWEVRLPPSLHQVEVLRPHDVNATFPDNAPTNPYLGPIAIQSRTQLTYTEARRLAESRVPARQTSAIRAEVLVRGPAGPAEARVARFTNAAFFGMFERPFAEGRPYDDAAASRGERLVVLGHGTGMKLFPRGGAAGQTVWIEGRPFRVAGVLAEYQPLNAPWQLLMIGGHEDALFLPEAEFDRLRAYPDQAILRSPTPPGRAGLLASDALFVTTWVDLPTPGHVAAYRADLDRLLGPGNWALRSLAEWHGAYKMPRSQIAFFGFLGFVVLLGGVSNLSRWLLTIGLMRADELSIYRALGAPRSSIIARTFAQGMILATPAALLGPLAALPLVALFNRKAALVDMPLELGTLTLIICVVPPLVASALGSLYPGWRLARPQPTLSYQPGRA